MVNPESSIRWDLRLHCWHLSPENILAMRKRSETLRCELVFRR